MTDAELRGAITRALYRTGRQRFLSPIMLAELAQADLAASRGARVELEVLLPFAERALAEPRRRA